MTSCFPASHALKAAGVVGTWETDVAAGRSMLDGPAAALMAGNPALAGRPLALEIALGRVHPGDQDWVFERIRRVRRTGGPFSAEFRVLDAAGDVRWILNRGSLMPDAEGAMRGRGAYIDVTDSHRAKLYPVGGPIEAPDAQHHLGDAAVHCLAAREAIGRSGHVPLRRLTDLMLWEIGRALAAYRRNP